jgi:hypothetical protein
MNHAFLSVPYYEKLVKDREDLKNNLEIKKPIEIAQIKVEALEEN